MLWQLAELSWLSPFAANITDCYSHCCCTAAMAIIHAIKSSCSLGPSSLVAALANKRHLPPNTNTLPLNMVTIAQTKWKPNFSVIYESTPLLIIIFCKYISLVDVNSLSVPYSYLIINTITPGYPHLTSKNENGGGGAGVKEKYSNMQGGSSLNFCSFKGGGFQF